jgi:hypothetical protein
MIISPGSSHSFRILVVWNDVVIVGKLFVADRAYPGLLPHLAVQQCSHLCRGSQFPISSRVVRIFDALNSQSYEPRLGKGFPATAGKRFVNWAKFVGTESHLGSPEVARG